MDSVKFVPPGGHRACLSCSAAKAKCVFADDGDGGDGFVDGLDFINSTTSDLAGPSQSSSSAKAGGQEGTPAVPRCQRCERLNRDCLLPTRPRKKRRPAGTRGYPAEQASSFPASRIPSLSKLSTSTGSASSPTYRGSGNSQPLQKRSTPGVQQQSPALEGPSSLLMQQQYAGGPTPSPGVKSTSISNMPSMPGHAPIPGSGQHQGQHPLSAPTQNAALPPPPSFSIRPPLPVGSSALSADPNHHSNSGSSSSGTAVPPGSGGNNPGPPPFATGQAPPGSPTTTGPAAAAAAAAAAVAPNAHQALIDSIFNMEERKADEILRLYRDTFSKFNPFMEPTSPDTKVADLQAEKPLVWLSIVFVTCYHDFERQSRLAGAIIYYITDKVFLSNAKSLSLLQGLLIIVNWFITQNFVLPQFTNLIHVTMAVITDLGLNKLEFSKTLTRQPLDRYVAKTMHGPHMVAPDEGHTLEERRALAGGFVLSHAMSDGILMVTPLHYTLQLEDTCRVFEASYMEKAAASAPISAVDTADYQLAITVRLYYLISRVLQVQREADLCGGRFMIPVRTHIENFVTELSRTWDGLSNELKDDFKIQLTYYTARIYIYELSLSAYSSPFKVHSTPSQDSDDGSMPIDGDMPIQCYLAVKSFFDIYLRLPVSLYYQFPVTLMTQLVHADITLAKLTAYFCGNTQPPGVPEGVTLPAFKEVIEAVASRFERARDQPHPLGYAVKNIIYTAFAARLRSYKTLDLASRRKNKKKGKEKAVATERKAKAPVQRATSQAQQLPNSNTVLSISNLIGTVPEQMNTEPDSDSEGNGPKVYNAGEMDVEANNRDDDMHGDLPDRSRPFTVDEESGLDHDVDMEGQEDSDDEEEAEEWRAWFNDFQSTLLGRPKPTSTTTGSVTGASAAPPSAGTASVSNATDSVAASSASIASVSGGASISGRSGTDDGYLVNPLMRHKGPSNVGSIGSLLNNSDQEPNYTNFMQGRKR
ncbi:hypothetical protein SEUCBS139899_002477 [Sporothrix eucalyptigena]